MIFCRYFHCSYAIPMLSNPVPQYMEHRQTRAGMGVMSSEMESLVSTSCGNSLA